MPDRARLDEGEGEGVRAGDLEGGRLELPVGHDEEERQHCEMRSRRSCGRGPGFGAQDESKRRTGQSGGAPRTEIDGVCPCERQLEPVERGIVCLHNDEREPVVLERAAADGGGGTCSVGQGKATESASSCGLEGGRCVRGCGSRARRAHRTGVSTVTMHAATIVKVRQACSVGEAGSIGRRNHDAAALVASPGRRMTFAACPSRRRSVMSRA